MKKKYNKPEMEKLAFDLQMKILQGSDGTDDSSDIFDFGGYKNKGQENACSNGHDKWFCN